MSFAMFACATLVVRIYGRPAEDDPDSDFLFGKFGSIPRTMLTLFELISAPNLQPYHQAMFRNPSLIGFLVIFVIFGSFGMIALLTGVISESIFEKNQFRIEEERLEREYKRVLLQEQCGQLFDLMDCNEDGSVSQDELRSRVCDIAEIFDTSGAAFAKEDLESIFYIMDIDGSGSIERSEFIHGVLQLCGSVQPMSIMELHYQLARCSSKVDRCTQNIDNMARLVDNIVENRQIDAHITGTIATQMRELLDGEKDENTAGISQRVSCSSDTFDSVSQLMEELADHKVQVAQAEAANSPATRFKLCGRTPNNRHSRKSRFGDAPMVAPSAPPRELDIASAYRTCRETRTGPNLQVENGNVTVALDSAAVDEPRPITTPSAVCSAQDGERCGILDMPGIHAGGAVDVPNLLSVNRSIFPAVKVDLGVSVASTVASGSNSLNSKGCMEESNKMDNGCPCAADSSLNLHRRRLGASPLAPCTSASGVVASACSQSACVSQAGSGILEEQHLGDYMHYHADVADATGRSFLHQNPKLPELWEISAQKAPAVVPSWREVKTRDLQTQLKREDADSTCEISLEDLRTAYDNAYALPGRQRLSAAARLAVALGGR